MKQNIVIVRLLSGEEVLCDLQDSETEGFVLLKHPTQIASGPNPQTGQVDVHMAPLLGLAAKKEIKVAADKIMFAYEPVEDIKDKFDQLFGSGLVKPSKKIITP